MKKACLLKKKAASDDPMGIVEEEFGERMTESTKAVVDYFSVL